MDITDIGKIKLTNITVVCIIILSLFIKPAISYAVTPQEYVADRNLADTSGFLNIKEQQVTVKDLLKKLSKETGVIFHTTILPSDKKDVICAGNLRQVLLCIVGENTNIVFRYNSNAELKSEHKYIVEAWLLAPNTEAGDDISHNSKVVDKTDFRLDRINRLLAEAKNPAFKVNAIERLAIEGKKEDVQVINALKDALVDINPGIRAQAIFGLGRMGVDDLDKLLEQAMSDTSVDVRLRALEVSERDSPLVKQALNDVNSSVREFAAIKLAVQNNN